MYGFNLVYGGFSYKVDFAGFMQLAFLFFYCHASNYYKFISNNLLTAFPPLLSVSEVTNTPDCQEDTHCKTNKFLGIILFKLWIHLSSTQCILLSRVGSKIFFQLRRLYFIIPSSGIPGNVKMLTIWQSSHQWQAVYYSTGFIPRFQGTWTSDEKVE